MIVRARDRVGNIYFNTDDIQFARAMPDRPDGQWAYIALRGGREFEINSPLNDVLAWWGCELR